MEKILVLSDSHSNAETVNAIVKKEGQCDHLVFCGDGLRDLAYLEAGSCILYAVPGNCDKDHPLYDEYAVEERIAGKDLLIVHGHRFDVKNGLELLLDYARSLDVSVVFFGHTHIPCKEEHEGILFINPGSASEGKYAVVTIDRGEWLVEQRTL